MTDTADMEAFIERVNRKDDRNQPGARCVCGRTTPHGIIPQEDCKNHPCHFPADTAAVPTEGQGPQGSAAWLFERVGYCTASRFDDVIAKTKAGKPTAARATYLWELVIERITGQPSDHWTSTAMQWGQDCEQRSKMAYEAATGAILEPIGFVKHPTLHWVGGSPDGLIGDDGGFESKSPFNPRYHLETLIAGEMPDEHKAQVQGGMWLTGRAWWDFQSFDPRLPAPLDRFCVRIERDDAYIEQLESEVITFSAEVAAIVNRLVPATA